MTYAERLMKAGELAEVVGGAVADCADVLRAIPGGPLQVRLTEAGITPERVESVANAVKSAPGVAVRGIGIARAAKDAYDGSNLQRFVGVLKDRGVFGHVAPPAHRTGRAK